MKYEPRLSNFKQLQDQVMDQIIRKIREDFKDAIAQALDEYVEAIIDEHISQRHFLLAVDDETAEIVVYWLMGDHPRADGIKDVFGTNVALKDLLYRGCVFYGKDYEIKAIKKTIYLLQEMIGETDNAR